MILFVMVTGALPFDEPNLPRLFEKIEKAEYSTPSYLSQSVVDLINKILEPCPTKRVGMAEIRSHPWFSETEEKEKIGANLGRLRQNSQQLLCKQVSIPSASEQDQIMSTILTAMRDLSFAAIASEETKIKGHKTGRRGAIGMTVTVSRRDNDSFSIDIRKGRGDIMEYSEELKKLLSKINHII